MRQISDLLRILTLEQLLRATFDIIYCRRRLHTLTFITMADFLFQIWPKTALLFRDLPSWSIAIPIKKANFSGLRWPSVGLEKHPGLPKLDSMPSVYKTKANFI